jgi:hypothetical protein
MHEQFPDDVVQHGKSIEQDADVPHSADPFELVARYLADLQAVLMRPNHKLLLKAAELSTSRHLQMQLID